MSAPLDILRPAAFKNRYFMLRHAESLANQQGIILSEPAVGCRDFGLTEAGKAALVRQAQRFRRELGEAHILCSDFLRTRETAAIVAAELDCEIELTQLLRERYFGDFEGTSNLNYEKVWAADQTDARHTQWNVESAWAVAKRAMNLVAELELRYANTTLLLVSHGDLLQILECVVREKPVGLHRELEPIQPGELRRLRCSET